MDPGYPLEVVPTYNFSKISEKLHDIENILVSRGHVPRVLPLDPPFGKFQFKE